MARLFLALWPDPATRASLAAVAARLAPRDARRTHTADLHATLVFLGEVDPARQHRLEAALDGVRGAPFMLHIDRAGYWRQPRVCWLGPGVVPPPLAALVADLRAACTAAGADFDARPYHCHVTIARRAVGPISDQASCDVRWPVTGFALVASGTAGAGARYSPVREWHFGGGSRDETSVRPVR